MTQLLMPGGDLIQNDGSAGKSLLSLGQGMFQGDPPAQTLNAVGIASAEAVGTATLTPGVATLSAAGIASVATVGTASLNGAAPVTNAGTMMPALIYPQLISDGGPASPFVSRH